MLEKLRKLWLSLVITGGVCFFIFVIPILAGIVMMALGAIIGVCIIAFIIYMVIEAMKEAKVSHSSD